MNFTIDAIIASLILTITFTFCYTLLLYRQYSTVDLSSLKILGKLLENEIFINAIYSNNEYLLERMINSAVQHSYYLAIYDSNGNLILELGDRSLRRNYVSIIITGWNGTINPRIIIFKVGVRR